MMGGQPVGMSTIQPMGMSTMQPMGMSTGQPNLVPVQVYYTSQPQYAQYAQYPQQYPPPSETAPLRV